MCRKLGLIISFTLVLNLHGIAFAAIPAGWVNEDVGTPTPGSANESNGTWTIEGNGNDIWNTSDNFHYAFVPLIGDGEISARVVDNGTGSNTWSKGGVMIRQDNTGPSPYAYMALTGGSGSGACFQWRDNPGAGAAWPGDHVSNISPPHWVKLVREGDVFSSYMSTDGVNWEPSGADPHTVIMTDPVLIGLAVTSHAAGELRTWTFDNVTVGLPVIAYGPDPKDEALHLDTWASLSWAPGHTAVSHDVYFGENAVDVEAGTADTFQGNHGAAFFIVGFPGNAYPDGLVPGTTYYWRVDEIEADGTKQTGPVWSFTVPPTTAYEPFPSDGSKFIPTDTVLSWTEGFGAKLHNVYFGESFEEVDSASGAGPHPTTTFNPGPLEFNKTYYWRVDEFNPPQTLKGQVWSFTTTLPGLGSAVMSRWENIASTDINTLKDNPKYPNNPDVSETVDSFAWDGADLSDYGARIEAWLYVPDTGDYTFWLNTDDQGELWLSTDDDSSNAVLIANESSWAGLNAWGSGEEQSDPVPLTAGQKYYIMAIWKEGGGGDHCQVAWQGPGIPERTIIPGSNLSPFEPVSAFGAKPANNATGVTQSPVLQWKPGLQATSHEVYFGSDEAAVANATKTSPEYKGSKALGDESYDPGKLPWESAFFWRIDEVNTLNPDSPWIGSVWSFTTADFLIVDDFEGYDSGDNQIWYSWYDGLGFGAPGTPNFFAGNGTGAAVGDETTASYTEETIVHGGRQSMPLNYDNNKQGFAKYSETELTLTFPRDFTEGGVEQMSIWFRGYPGSVGSFVEGPVGTITMTGSGTDIWGNVDEFHFAYKMLSGAGSIIARVNSIDNTNPWAKAQVMIRESLEPGSVHASMAVTPENGISFQRRLTTDGASTSDNSTANAEVAPHWVKIERDLAGNFTASHSTNGTTWQVHGTPQNIQMGTNVYIGLAVTSHDTALTCQAVFTNVTTTGNVSGQWTNQDIGIDSNAAEPLYVALSNTTGAAAVIVHDDPAASQIDVWTEWIIPLQAFADQGIVLTDVDRIAVGMGTKGNMTIPGGKGKMFFDDIRLIQPAGPEPQP